MQPFAGAAVALVGGALFLEMLDGSLLANALPAMAREFGVAAVDLKLAVTAYLLAVAIGIPCSGWVARRYDPRMIFIAALGLFALASLACAASTSVAALVAARTVQGLAGAMMVPVGRLLVLRDLPKAQLIRAIAVLTWPALLAPAIAPPLSGFAVEYASWRWLFAVNVPLCLGAMRLALLLLPAITRDARVPLDGRGLLLWMCTAVLLIGVLGDLPNLGVFPAIGAICATALLATLLLRHVRRAACPLLDLSALGDRNFRHVMSGGSCVRMAIFANPFLLPLMLQLGLGLSPVEAGLLLLIGTLGNIGMKPLTTPIIRRFPYRRILMANGALLTVGFLALACLHRESSPQAIAALLVATGMARSMHFSALNTLAFRSVEPARMSGANTLFSTVVQMNAAMGVVVAALAVDLWPALSDAGATDPMSPYRFALVVIAALTAVGTVEAIAVPGPSEPANPVQEMS